MSATVTRAPGTEDDENATAIIPAAFAASMPSTLSSTTTHRAGGTPTASAAARKTSGAGLRSGTSHALKIRPSNQR